MVVGDPTGPDFGSAGRFCNAGARTLGRKGVRWEFVREFVREFVGRSEKKSRLKCQKFFDFGIFYFAF